MAAIRNFNNSNNDENNNNNNNDDNRPYLDSSNNKGGNGKYYVIILAVAAVAVIVTSWWYFEAQALERETVDFIDGFLAGWRETNGNNGYTAIESIMLSSDFKEQAKEAIKKSATEMDKRHNLVNVIMDYLPEYMQRYALSDPSLSNLERGMMLTLFNNWMNKE
jgi:hypothetical protein